MRITTGLYKGYPLSEVPGDQTRPTQDKVRQAVFNMLFHIENDVLDLFAGTGAYGLEALSRGAKRVVLVDSSKKAYQVMEENARKMDRDKLEIYQKDYRLFIKDEKRTFDYIFMDPPYDLIDYQALFEAIYPLCKKQGVLIFESRKEEVITAVAGTIKIKEAIYGMKKITIFCKE